MEQNDETRYIQWKMLTSRSFYAYYPMCFQIPWCTLVKLLKDYYTAKLQAQITTSPIPFYKFQIDKHICITSASNINPKRNPKPTSSPRTPPKKSFPTQNPTPYQPISPQLPLPTTHMPQHPHQTHTPYPTTHSSPSKPQSSIIHCHTHIHIPILPSHHQPRQRLPHPTSLQATTSIR